MRLKVFTNVANSLASEECFMAYIIDGYVPHEYGEVSSRGMEVDKAKIKVISSLPPPKNVKGVRSFLGHAGFYRRFIKGFSVITKPLCNLLLKDVAFDFTNECLQAFDILKEKLVQSPILQPSDWTKPFEIMCDASDTTIGAVLG
ncbi:putative mitochondrial protein AtMg00860 [Bidens hawaiensis]|uniref:putative mitochondrial protein AtMg00860 n=1 Tax=Bidens hawaiensis TaxID=980011 RepID=UPI004049C582